MHNQLSTYSEKILSKFQCGFRKGFSTQHCLLLMSEKRKHAKLNAYGLSLSALKLVHNYLQKRKQGTKNGIASPIAYRKNCIWSSKDRSWVQFHSW